MIKKLSLRALVSVILVFGALLTGAAGFIGLASLAKPEEQREETPRILSVEAYRVEQLPLREYLSSFGAAEADRETVISAEVSGRIVRVNERFEVGEEMRAPYPEDAAVDSDSEPSAPAGDELVLIDPELYLEKRAQIEGRIAESKAEMKRLEQQRATTIRFYELARKDTEEFQKDYERRKQLIGQGVRSNAERIQLNLELQSYEKALAKAENDRDQVPIEQEALRQQLKTLQAEWNLADQDVRRTRVRVPFNGFLSEVFVEEGTFVRVGDPIARLTDVSRVVVPAPLTLHDYEKINPALRRGKEPQVELSLHEGEATQWTGRLVRVAPEADLQSRTIEVYIEVDNATQPTPLLPGTFVHARIEGPAYRPDEVVAIPRDALRPGDSVFTIVPSSDRKATGKVETRKLHVLEKLQSLALVKSGIVPGNYIVMTNLDILRDGMTVDAGDRIRNFQSEMARLGADSANVNLNSADPE